MPEMGLKFGLELRSRAISPRSFTVSIPEISLLLPRDSAGDQSKTRTKHQQYEDRERQSNAPSQRSHCSVACTMISVEEEKAGKQAADHANQHDKDDELEHCRLQ